MQMEPTWRPLLVTPPSHPPMSESHQLFDETAPPSPVPSPSSSYKARVSSTCDRTTDLLGPIHLFLFFFFFSFSWSPFLLFSSPPSSARSEKRGRRKALAASMASETNNTQNGGQQKQQFRHQEVGHKSLLQSDQLYQYILDTSVYPREAESMRELREITAKHPWNLMTTSADEGQFLNMLLKLIGAKKTMEIGVYTGYSLLATALAIPHDGTILAMDINRENYELGLPAIEKAGVAHKIDFREGPAMPVLDQLIEDKENHGSFDFVFVDADKDNYINYHKRLLELVKVGGLIAYDNTLWNGAVVAPPEAPLRKYVRHYLPFVLELNKALAADPRIEICQLPVGDGVTLCRRIK